MGDLSGDRFEEVEITGIDQLHRWLQHHHSQSEGIWLITFKKTVAEKYIPHDEVPDALVAFDWCDGVRRRIDDCRTMHLISPRRTPPRGQNIRTRTNC